MSSEKENWFSFSEPESQTLFCAYCSNEIVLSAFLDHDPAICPNCKIECAYLDWKDRKLQIVPQNAPEEFVKFLRFLQKDFDELEYVELLACFEEMENAIK